MKTQAINDGKEQNIKGAIEEEQKISKITVPSISDT